MTKFSGKRPAFHYHLRNSNLISYIIELVVDALIIFGPIIGYIPQYFHIRRSSSFIGFSSKISLILLSSSILRIFFWFLKPFDLPLLFQASLMIIVQLALLHCIVAKKKIQASTENLSLIKPILLNEPKPKESFWEWSSFRPYLICILGYTAICSSITAINLRLVNSSLLTQCIGYSALMIESTLGIPQFLSNYRRKSTVGLCRILVALWFLGDIGKTCLFFYRKTELPFILCGIIQTLVDIGIFFQIQYYSST